MWLVLLLILLGLNPAFQKEKEKSEFCVGSFFLIGLQQWQMVPDPQTVFCVLLFLLLFWFLSKKGSVWSISAFQLQKYIYSPVGSSFLIFGGRGLGVNFKKFLAYQIQDKEILNLSKFHLMNLITFSSVCLNIIIPHSIFNSEKLSHKGGGQRRVSPTAIRVFAVYFQKASSWHRYYAYDFHTGKRQSCG